MEITERNLQEIGKSLFLSLPKGWTRTLKLKKGSKIKVRTSEDGTLVISPDFVSLRPKDNSKFEYRESFTRDFFKAYFSGSEKIEIGLENIKQKELSLLYDFLKKFMNVQIVEDNSKKIVVKCFKIEELSIGECLTRMHHICVSMFDEIIEGSGEIKMVELEDSLTKFYFMLVMQIRRFLEEGKYVGDTKVSLLRAMDYRMIGEKIERICDILKSGEFRLGQLEYLKKIYEKSFWSFFNRKYENSLKIFGGVKDKEFWEIYNKGAFGKSVRALSEVENLKRIYGYSKEIASLSR